MNCSDCNKELKKDEKNYLVDLEFDIKIMNVKEIYTCTDCILYKSGM